MTSTVLRPAMVVVYLGLFQAALSGCSNDSERVLTQAPQSNEELGFLVSGATIEQRDKFFSENSDVKIRKISEENIVMFEAVNTDLPTLRENFPNSRIIRNEFYRYTNTKQTKLTLNQLRNIGFNLQNKIQSTDDASFDLKSCREDSLKPISKMSPASMNLTERRPLVAGEKVKLTSSSSQPHAFIGGALKKAWVVEAPQGSYVQELTFSDTLEIDLDTMGMYQVYLLVQDQKQNCQFDNISISVTGNTPYMGVALSSVDAKVANQTYHEKLGLNQAHQNTKGEGQLIAIVDSGVNYNHPYLSENIFTNTNEIPGNGIDDDGNGLVDDVHGWDFVYNDEHPYDDLGHGSHVAGLAAGKVFGIAPNAKILPIKAGSNSGMLDLGTVFQAVIYALRMDADIINLSLGGERSAFREEIELYKHALSKNTIIIAAAGNGEPSRFGIYLGVDIDNKNYSPAGIKLENVLSVSSLSNNDKLAYYSNFGQNKINVATYGGEDFDLDSRQPYDGQLYSAYIENAKGELFFGAQGTSMAAPVAAGITALVKSINPNMPAGQVTRLLENAGPEAPILNGKVKSGRILTADSAVEIAKMTLQLIN